MSPTCLGPCPRWTDLPFGKFRGATGALLQHGIAPSYYFHYYCNCYRSLQALVEFMIAIILAFLTHLTVDAFAFGIKLS